MRKADGREQTLFDSVGTAARNARTRTGIRGGPSLCIQPSSGLLFAKVTTMCDPTSPTLMSWTLMRTVRRGGGCWAAWGPTVGLDCTQGAGSRSIPLNNSDKQSGRLSSHAH